MARLLASFVLLVGCGGPPAVSTPGGGGGPTDGSTPAGGTGGGDPPASTGSWLATYDLTGSQFFVQSMVDFTITVQEPYEDDLHTGPGHVVLRFPDVDGAMGAGEVAFVEYHLTWDFVTGVSGFADVHTQVENQAGPEPVGLTTGTLAGGELAWDPPEIHLCQVGQISCDGPFCGTSGAPPEDQPEIVDDCGPWGINPFTFSPDLQVFDMRAALVSSDGDTETAMAFHGTLVDAVYEDPS